MASINNTRVGDTHEKKSKQVMVVEINDSTRAEYPVAGDYLVGYLPEQAIVKDATVFTIKAEGSVLAITVGTTEAGAELMTLGDAAALGTSGTFAGDSYTGTGVPVYVNLSAVPAVGVFSVVIEYTELTLNSGLLTLID